METPLTAKFSARRRWLFLVITVAGVPLILLGTLELLMRLVGFGYPTSFFLRDRVEGQELLRTNHAFTYQFFPPALARGIIPHKIVVDSRPPAFRIFLFGESAANGDPDPAYGMGPQLEALLEARFQSVDFEVVCTAVTAINSHVILPIARECATIPADLWIVYMGNNEVVGPFGPASRFGTRAFPLPAVRASLALRRARLGQALQRLIQKAGGGAEAPDEWAGIQMFTDALLHPADPALARVYKNFQNNLDDILLASKEAGIPVLLNTLASNLRDCAPFASLNHPALSPPQRDQWENSFAEGKELLQNRQADQALILFQQAASIDPTYAELQFLLAKTLALTGRSSEAMEAYKLARDYDALRVRADSTINQIIRQAAQDSRFGNVHLVDLETAFGRRRENRPPGMDVFFDHVHFTFPGNFTTASLLAENILPLLPEYIRQKDLGQWPSADQVFQHRALSLYDQVRVWSDMAERLKTPPYNQRLNGAAAVAYCESIVKRSSARIQPEADRLLYASALERLPQDYWLRQKWGDYLLNNGEHAAAIAEYEWVVNEFPTYEGGHHNLGLALLVVGQTEKAAQHFRRVLQIRPGYRKATQALEWIQNPQP